MRGGFEIELDSDASLTIRIFGAADGSSRLIQVAQSERNDLVVALVGCLFDDDPPGETERSAERVLDTYVRGGSQNLLQLDGEFSLALIDRRMKRIIVRRDPRGTYPVYWTVINGRPLVGTSLRSLADRLPHREISAEYVAKFLAFPYAFSELPEATTVWKGINRVRPETMLGIDFDGNEQELGHWSWTDDIPNNSGISFEDAKAEFLVLLQEAIRKRMAAKRAGAHLSGGMDSSSIACLAREALSGTAAQDRLSTFSLTYQSRLLACERQLMQDVINGGSVDAHLLPGDEALHFGWFDGELPLMDEPYAGLFEFASQKLMADAAAASGVDVLLSGVGIEHSLESTRLQIAEQLCAGAILSGWKTARRWAQAANVRTWSVFAQQGLVPAASSILPARLARTWVPRWFADVAGRAAFPDWISPEFSRRMRMGPLAAQLALAPFCTPFERHYTRFGLHASCGNWGAWTLLVPHGIRLSHPFLDTDVVRFCLGIPRAWKEQPGCRKRLLREAMTGRLPESIRRRRFKRGFNDVFWRGLTGQVPRIRRMIAETTLFETGWLRRDRLEAGLDAVAMGVGDTRAGGRLASTLALIAWYEQHNRPCDLTVRKLPRIRNLSPPATV